MTSQVHIYQEKQKLKIELEKYTELSNQKRKQMENIIDSRKANIEENRRSIQKKRDQCKECESWVLTIKQERIAAKQELERLTPLEHESKQQFEKLSAQGKHQSSLIAQIKEELYTLKDKYPANKSYQVNSETDKDFERIDSLSKDLKDKGTILSELKKSIEKSAVQLQKVRNERKNQLKRVNQLVQKEEKQTQIIRESNASIKNYQSQASSYQAQINEIKKELLNFDMMTREEIIKRQDAISYLPFPEKDEAIFISPEGLQEMIKNFDPKCPEKGVFWTADYKTQMPIFLKKKGFSSRQPITIPEMWHQVLEKYSKSTALSFQVSQGVWKSINYQEYYNQSIRFGKACIALGISEYTPIMIMGFNSPQWVFTFNGGIFGRYLPIGMYTTNGPETCEYIANHCEGELVVLEDKTQLQKYYSIIDQCPKIRYFIIYKQGVPSDLPASLKGRVITWNDFMTNGDKFKAKNANDTIEGRMNKQRPGNCATFIYTSGTTGMPKAVMVSHDGYLFLVDMIIESFNKYSSKMDGNDRILSYLPLSHAAGQILDVINAIRMGAHVYFAHPSVLQGTMPKYLLAAKPTMFLGVPRVWQKLEQRLTEVISTTTGLKKKLLDWAMGLGIEGTFAEIHGKPTPLGWSIAKRLFTKIKSAMGLQNCEVMITGAAPMRESTRKFFLQINISFFNGYGMSETSGPHSITDPMLWTEYCEDYLKEGGNPVGDLEVSIQGQDKEGKGQICMRGRNRFMGYYKNEEENKKTINRKGFVHSGDQGKVDNRGTVFITGRLKELIVTAGGQNIPPVLLENQIIKTTPILSQVVVIGDYRKYLTCLTTLKVKTPTQLADQVVDLISKQGSKVKTVKEALNCPIVNKIIKKGLEEANKKALSNAQKVHKHLILPAELTIDTGALTPTMKLRRKIIHEMYKAQIQSMYIDSKI